MLHPCDHIKYLGIYLDETLSVYYNEIKINSLDQYSCRSNVEIKNIPENINQSNIEQYILKVFEAVAVRIQSYDLVAVHRIGKFVQLANVGTL